DDEGADRRDQVPLREIEPLVVGVDAARHSLEAEDVHRIEGEVEADEGQPEVELADLVVQHPAERLGPPVVHAAEEAEHRPTEQAETATGPRPTANMWWTHTPQLMNPMAMPESTITGYPNSGLRENTGRISDTMPMAGRMRMYTSG